jgi:hypothetical protein
MLPILLVSREPDFYSRTSNDLLLRLTAKQPRLVEYYETIAQTAHELRDTENSPAISMTPHLIVSGQMALLRSISIYSERGGTPEQVRLLYMNQTALSVWRSMGKSPNAIGSQKRPPRTALLAYGVPFSE